MGGVDEAEKHTVVTGTCASCGRSDVKVSTAQVGPTMLLRSARVPGDPRQVYDTSIVCSLTGWQGLAALVASGGAPPRQWRFVGDHERPARSRTDRRGGAIRVTNVHPTGDADMNPGRRSAPEPGVAAAG